jgi:hypothetical protein
MKLLVVKTKLKIYRLIFIFVAENVKQSNAFWGQCCGAFDCNIVVTADGKITTYVFTQA